MLGLKNNLKHVWFGLMRLPEATFSNRRNVIKLSDLLDEAENRALKIIKCGNNNLDNEKQLELAKAIGIGQLNILI